MKERRLRSAGPAKWRGGRSGPFHRLGAVIRSVPPAAPAARVAMAGLLAGVLFLRAGTTHAESPSLSARVRQAHRELRALETLYRRNEARGERAAALQTLLARATWLVQIGGLPSASEDALLALARLKALGRNAPLRYGYLAESSGAPWIELNVRRAEAGELPEALRAFERRLFFVRLENASARGVVLRGRPFLERPLALAQGRRLEALPLQAWPEALRRFAEVSAWPERIEAGRAVRVLALFPKFRGDPAALGVRLRQADPAGSPERVVRAPFVEIQHPEAFAQAKRKAVRLEKEMLQERERRRRKEREKAAKAPAVRALPQAAPQRKTPRGIGVAERAGAGDRIQVRLDPGARFQPGAVFQVFKQGRWIGRVIVPGTVSFKAGKRVYWFKILEGAREQLAGGLLHPVK